MNRKMIINGVAIDPRTLDEAKQARIDMFREQTYDNIVNKEGIDAITQTNASLGLYDAERVDEITSKISHWRNRFLTAKAAIEAATTNEQVDAVML